VTYFTNFGTFLLSPEWLKIQISNLARRLTVRDTKPKNEKWVKKAWPRSRNLLYKFWDPLISPEWLKILISNFACGLMVRDAIQKNKKLVKRGSGLSHMTYFSNFGTP